jgi:hypothetical protein
MNKKIIFSAITSIILFSGCASKDIIQNDLKKNLKSHIKYSKDINITKYLKEKNINSKFIDFSINKDLKSALATLNTFDKNNIYILKDTQTNIVFPPLTTEDSEKLKINTFKKLKKFVEKITSYTLMIKGNPFKKGIKIIEVIDKNRLKTNIFDYPFSIQGKITFRELLKEISQKTHYSILFDNRSLNSNTSSTNKQINKHIVNNNPGVPSLRHPSMFNNNNNTDNNLNIPENTDIDFNEQIVFNGKTIGELLTYLSNQFNYFIDIDYKNKIISFKKYKTFTFPIILPKDDGLSKIDSSLSSNTFKTKVDNFLKTLKSFVKDGKIEYSNGYVYAYITKKDFQTINKLINYFNKDILRTAKLKIEIYTFIVKRNTNFGVNLNFIEGKLKGILNYTAKTPLTIKNDLSKNYQKAGINLQNEYLFLGNKNSYYYQIANKIPLYIDLSKNKNYIKSLKTTTTSSTSTTTQTETEIGEIQEGQKFVILPSIYSDKVLLKILYTNTTNEELKEVKIDKDNTIMLPTTSKESFPSVTTLRFGERKIIGIYQAYINSDDYTGFLPKDIDVIRIPGNTNQKYLREIIAVVVNVEK